MTKIYTTIKRDKKETVRSFLEKLYPSYSCIETYSDPKCTIRECAAGRNRSLDALYEICKTRFPNLTQNTFLVTLYGFLEAKADRAILYCPTIDKWVVMVSNYGNYGMSHNHTLYDYNGSRSRMHITGDGTICANTMYRAVGLIT